MKKQSLLWRITHPDLEQPSYLFGTMHVQDARVFVYSEQLQDLILACDAFASEFNLDEMVPEAAAIQSQLADGQTLEDVLKPNQWKRLQRFFAKRIPVDVHLFYHQQPIAIANFLSVYVFQKEMQQSLDETLFSFAKEHDKTLFGLETFEEQLEIMRHFDLKTQVKQLMEIIRNFKKFNDNILKMTSLYTAGRVHDLYKASKQGLGKMRKVMLYDRNATMADAFHELAQSQTLFCAVGAGHLSGKKGVLKHLKDKNYSIKPITLRLNSIVE